MEENTSGQGKQAVLPPELSGWSWNWGAFLWNWLWGIFNRTYLALLVFVPLVGIVIPFVLGFRGNAWAWRNKRWESLEHFRRVQKKWAIWGFIFFLVSLTAMAGGIFFLLDTMKNSPLYVMAMDKTQINREALKIMGAPLEPGWWITGKMSVDGPDGKAEITIPVKGSKQEGTIYVKATKTQNKWKIEKLHLLPAGGGAILDLLAVPPPPKPAAPPSVPAEPPKDTPPPDDQPAFKPRPSSTTPPVVVPSVSPAVSRPTKSKVMGKTAPAETPIQKPTREAVVKKKSVTASGGSAVIKGQGVRKTKKKYATKTIGTAKATETAARARITAGDYKGAIKTLTAMIAYNPEESVNYRLRGNAYDNLGNSKRAIADWKKAASLGDTLIQSYLNFLEIDWDEKKL